MSDSNSNVVALVLQMLGRDANASIPVAIRAYDGSSFGSSDAPITVTINSPRAFRHIISGRGELGIARAYISGDIDIDGDIFALASLRDQFSGVDISPNTIWQLIRQLGVKTLLPLAPPPEEIRLRGRRHSEKRDREAISHHYNIGNDFYRLVLGPSMTYSCAVFTSPNQSLEDAEENKYELISRKLNLQSGMRLLDVGCGWGGMVLHAAETHGVDAVGVTLAQEQVDLAEKRIANAGLANQIKIRNQDYRMIDDGPYDAISSIGMFEHVGKAKLQEYFQQLFALVRPGGRVLNHAISRAGGTDSKLSPRSFMNRYVFPDGELLEVGTVISAMQEAGFEVRHEESLREHYALTLRHWVANLEANWDEAVELVGEARARVWRLYMAGSALSFEAGAIQIHQVLGVRPDHGESEFPLRNTWEPLR